MNDQSRNMGAPSKILSLKKDPVLADDAGMVVMITVGELPQLIDEEIQ